MKTRFGLALVLVLFGMRGGQVWGQGFRFIPIPGPAPIRPPVHLPFHPPTSIPQITDRSHPDQAFGTHAWSDGISTFLLVCLGITLLAILVSVPGAISKSHSFGGLIRITSTPPGEAPPNIREAWVGLKLPLAPKTEQGEKLTAMGVLSGKQGCTIGYAVEGRAALERLAARSPEAAAWWRENVPCVVDSRYQFIFPVENCQKLD
jgi:hypothetical protein